MLQTLPVAKERLDLYNERCDASSGEYRCILFLFGACDRRGYFQIFPPSTFSEVLSTDTGKEGKKKGVLLISGRFGTLASRRLVANDKGERKIFRASNRFECCDLDKRSKNFLSFLRLGNPLPGPISIRARANSILISISRPALSSASLQEVNRHWPTRRVLVLSFSLPFTIQRFSGKIGLEKSKRKGRKEETDGKRARVDVKILQRSWK